nr:VanZ family protein [Lysinibacillus timonensis]
MRKYFVLVVAGLLIVFLISSMSYQQQTLIPTLRKVLENRPFYEFLSSFEFTYWGRTISVESRGYYYFVEFLIRKGTHFIGYGLIGVLCYLFYRKFNLKFAVVYAISTTFMVACLDEYHQTFVPGRTGVFQDVLLDTAGAITFVLLCKMILSLRSFSKNRKHSATN